MLFAVLLAVVAIAQAAAISKSISRSPSFFEPLVERRPMIHNYALVCLYDRDATNFCQKWYGYGCDSMGKMRTVFPYQKCDSLCQCINLAPKPACMVGLTGQSWCLRAAHQEQEQEISTTAEESSPGDRTMTKGVATLKSPLSTCSSSATVSATSSQIVQTSDSQQSSGRIAEALPTSHHLAPRDTEDSQIPHNYAMVCASDRQETTWCENDGYYCNSHGKVVAGHTPNKYCSDYCTCIDVGTRKFCMLASSGAIYCLRSEEDSGIDYSDQLGGTPAELETASTFNDKITKRSEEQDSVSRAESQAIDLGTPLEDGRADWGHNNMAMACSDDRIFTKSCAEEHGYFCCSSGSLIRQGDRAKNDNCEATCLCTDLHPKPACIINFIGGAQCARDIQEIEYANEDTASSDLDVPLEGKLSDWGSHNMALVCLDNRGFTNFCQKSHGYFCSASGSLMQLAKRRGNVACENNCLCVDMFPKSRCITNLIGMAYCARGIEDVEEMGEEESEKTDMVVSALEVPLHTDRANANVNNMAMVCWDNKFLTTRCAEDYLYFCSRTGELIRGAEGQENSACEKNCRCVNLHPKPHCMMNLIGVAVCARDVDNVEDLEDVKDEERGSVDIAESAPRLASRNEDAGQDTNNMALVCWDDQYLTRFCAQNYGHFCDAAGKLHQKPGSTTGSSCDDNCRCVDLSPKPYCVFTLIGGAQCARNVKDVETENADVVASTNLGAEHRLGANEQANHRPSPDVGGSSRLITAVIFKSTMITSIKTAASLQVTPKKLSAQRSLSPPTERPETDDAVSPGSCLQG